MLGIGGQTMYKQRCADCGREWFDFKLSWWCDDCREKHIPKMADVLKKVNGRGRQ